MVLPPRSGNRSVPRRADAQDRPDPRRRDCAPTSRCAAASTCRCTWAARDLHPRPASAATPAARCAAGDVLHARRASQPSAARPRAIPPMSLPQPDDRLRLRIAVDRAARRRRTSSPRPTSTSCTPSTWKVHYNSSRTGVRLIGPRPHWARAMAARPDCIPRTSTTTPTRSARSTSPATCRSSSVPTAPVPGRVRLPVRGDPGRSVEDRPARARRRVRFVAVDDEARAAPSSTRMRRSRACGRPRASPRGRARLATHSAILGRRERTGARPRGGLPAPGRPQRLVEYGPQRARSGTAHPRPCADAGPAGASACPASSTSRRASARCRCTSTPRRSSRMPTCCCERRDGRGAAAGCDDFEIPSRVVHLPLSWEDPAIYSDHREVHAVGARRRALVSGQHRIHPPHQRPGLDRRRARIVFDARYLVMGLGDVYLGAPVATPVDPRHRLVTTKYNPGAHLDAAERRRHRRRLPVHLRHGGTGRLPALRPHHPGVEHLSRRPRRSPTASPGCCGSSTRSGSTRSATRSCLDLRAETEAGRFEADVADGWFDYGSYTRFVAASAASIAEFRARQAAAFEAEKDRWRAAGEFDRAAGRGGRHRGQGRTHVPSRPGQSRSARRSPRACGR